MRRALMVLSLGLGLPLTACLDVKPCSSDADCGAGRCDVELQFCVFDPDSGVAATGGGTATGGGGGATGGGGGADGGGGEDSGVDAGSDAGLDAGFDAGVDTSRDAGTDAGTGCAMVCSDPFECAPSPDGGRCIGSYVLRFQEPQPDVTFNASSTTAEFSIVMLRIDGGVPMRGTVPFSIAGFSPAPPSVLVADGGGVYRATATLPATGMYQAVAGWAGGPRDTVNFMVDREPPVLSLQLAPPPGNTGGRYLRDALLRVVIRSDKPLERDPVLTLTGTNLIAHTQQVDLNSIACGGFAPPPGPLDFCATLDLAQPWMGGGLNQSFTASVSGIDLAGNTATANLSVPVTRLRWRLPTLAPATQVRAALALDKQGNLYVGTQDSADGGRLISYTPTGAQRFSLPTGAVHGIAISDSEASGGVGEFAWVTSVGQTSTMRMHGTGNGASLGSVSSSCQSANKHTTVAPGLYDAGTFNGLMEVAAITGFNSNQDFVHGEWCTTGPRTGVRVLDGGLGRPEFPVADGTSGSLLSPLNIVVSGERAYTLGFNRQLTWVDLSPLRGGGSGGAHSNGGVPTGLAQGGNAIVGTWTGVGSASEPVSVYQPNLNAVTFPASNMGNTARSPVLLSGSLITTTNELGTSWVMSSAVNLTTATPSFAAAAPVGGPAINLAAETGATSPVVGTGNKVFVVRRDSTVLAYDAVASGGLFQRYQVWSAQLFSPAVDVVAHPTLDCNRTAGGNNRPGTLYVAALDGQLAAVIVDSAKLETSAPWPKFQRTAGNAGNPAFPLNPGCP